MKRKILGTGLSGLIGSRVVELLSDKYDFFDLSLKSGIDITHYNEVEKIIKTSEAKVILHLAAYTDVDQCEDEKILGEEGKCWQVNVEGTKNITEVAKRTNKKVIYVSTDFVFNGTKDFYTEEDLPDPVNWYGYTKFEGEKIVSQSGVNYNIVRLAYPYRACFPEKEDFVRKIINSAQRKEKIVALTDHIFTPTFIDDIAYALDFLLNKDFSGIFHLVGSQSLTPYEAVWQIFRVFNLQGEIEGVKREEYFKGRAFRPCRLALKNAKITKLGVKMSSFTEGLLELKKQLSL